MVGDSAWLECAVGVVDTAEAAGSTAIHFGSWNLHLQCGRRPHGASQASKEAPQRSSPPWCANGTGILSHAHGWGAWVVLLRGWRRPQPSSRGCTVAHSGLMHMFDPECVVRVRVLFRPRSGFSGRGRSPSGASSYPRPWATPRGEAKWAACSRRRRWGVGAHFFLRPQSGPRPR